MKRDMAERQEIGNYFVPDNPRMINNITERNEQQYLLLSTTYPLNSSHTKKLCVGLQSTKEGTFQPNVKLIGNYTERISFDSNTSQQFQENMGLTYLNGSSKIKINPISFANIFVSFMVTRKQDKNFPKETLSAST